MTAAQVHGMHEQARNYYVPELRPRSEPARPRDEHDRHETCYAESKTKSKEGERRRVLQANFRREEARAPDYDEVPGEQRVEAACL